MSFQEELIRRFELQEEYLGCEKPVNKIIPLASVTVTTFQHVNYIKDCIEGILLQNTNFQFEIIIGDDESTDGTREICKEYAEKYPEKIRLFLRDRKLSQYYDHGKYVGRFNGRWIRMSARGKYIALCEGDDYWTDPLKLQKQVDFLEKNEDYGLVYTEFDRYNQTTQKIEKNCFRNQLGLYPNTFEDFLIYTRFLAPVTWVLRTSLLQQINLLYKDNYVVGDLPILLTVSKYTKIGYIDDSTAVYRVLQYSASHFNDCRKEFKFDIGIFNIQMDFAATFNVPQNIITEIKNRFYQYIYTTASILNDIEVKNNAYYHLKENHLLTKKMKIILLLTRYNVLRKIFKNYILQ